MQRSLLVVGESSPINRCVHFHLFISSRPLHAQTLPFLNPNFWSEPSLLRPFAWNLIPEKFFDSPGIIAKRAWSGCLSDEKKSSARVGFHGDSFQKYSF